MVEVKQLTQLYPEDLQRLISGYVSDAKYLPNMIESEDHLTITLQLVPLVQPYTKHYAHPDAETLEHYGHLPQAGFSFVAYDTDKCVGIALSEARHWHKSLHVCEFHIAPTHRRRGLGRRLMEVVAEKALAAGMRTIVCETQTTNVPAIRFYHRLGFRIEGIDLSYYSNEDYLDGEVALFMKKRLT